MFIICLQLEKYSTNLEKVVAARTGQLAVEKQKTEDLLSSKDQEYILVNP